MDKSDPVIIAMKGHPGTGKSTLARGIAAHIGCPLLDKDDVKDSTQAIQQFLANDPQGLALLNDLSYTVLWQIAKTQLDLGLTVIVDSPLSRRIHLDCLLELASPRKTHIIIVECRAQDEALWRHRLEQRAAVDDANSHKPGTWEELQTLVEKYQGCNDYDVGNVPKITVDTTGKADTDQLVSVVLEFISNKVRDAPLGI